MNDLNNLHKILNELVIYSKDSLYNFISELISNKISESLADQNTKQEEAKSPALFFGSKSLMFSAMVQNDVSWKEVFFNNFDISKDFENLSNLIYSKCF